MATGPSGSDIPDDVNPFLRAVLQSPNDDAPRLIYADYLDEQGDPRGEFIRCQCELEITDEFSVEYYELRDRIADLLKEHREQWAKELEQDASTARFTRGFIETIWVGAPRFLKDPDALLNSAPIRWLRLVSLQGFAQDLANVESLRRIQALDLSWLQINMSQLAELLSSPHLENLTDLDVAKVPFRFTERIGSVMSRSAFNHCLESLDISTRNDLAHSGGHTREFMDALVSAEWPRLRHLSLGDGVWPLERFHVPNLNSIELRNANLSETEVDRLAQLPLHQLHRLNLYGTSVTANLLPSFCRAGALNQIKELDLRHCDLTLQHVLPMFSQGRLAKCERLRLNLNHSLERDGLALSQFLANHAAMQSLRDLQMPSLSATGLKVLAESPATQELKRLVTDGCTMTNQDAEAIMKSMWPESLCELDLRACHLHRFAVRILCDEAQFPNVLRLSLGERTAIVPEDVVAYLLDSGAFPNVRHLSLSHLSLTPETLKTIAKCEHLTELRELAFHFHGVDEESVLAVLQSDRLPNLRRVTIYNSEGLRDKHKFAKQFGGRLKV